MTLPPGYNIPVDSNGKVPNVNDDQKHPAASLEIPTIVLLHGLGLSPVMFHPIINKLGWREKYRVVTYDLEGHGQTPLFPATGDITLDKVKKTLSEVMDWVGVRKFSLIGHSLGGVRRNYHLHPTLPPFENSHSVIPDCQRIRSCGQTLTSAIYRLS